MDLSEGIMHLKDSVVRFRLIGFILYFFHLQKHNALSSFFNNDKCPLLVNYYGTVWPLCADVP